MNNSKNIKGQSLFELVVVVAVVSFFLLALVGAVSRSIATSAFSRQKSLANRYTQEAMEWIRRERDLDWTAFYSRASGGGALYCVNELAFDSGSCSGKISGTSFSREVTLTSVGADRVEVSIVVYWSGPTGRHETKADMILTDWKNL